MDWTNEVYVRMYTRETDDDLALSWQAVALWRAMLARFDRAGFIATRRGARGLAAVVRIPADVVTAALPDLLVDGRVIEVADSPAGPGFFAPNFFAAQDAVKTDRQRQREFRMKRSAETLVGAVTKSDRSVTKSDETVTLGHAPSHGVTLSLAERSEAELSESRARAHDPPCPDPTQPPSEPTAIAAPIASSGSARMGGGSRAPAAIADDGTDAWCTRRWADVNAHRGRIAKLHGLAEVRELHPMDDGRRELAARMREGYTRDDIRHVIRVVVAEAEAKRTVEWLSGAMFRKQRVDSALARSPITERDAKPANARGDDGMRPMPGPPRGDEPQLDPRYAGASFKPTLTPEQRAAMLEELRAKTAAEHAEADKRVPMGPT